MKSRIDSLQAVRAFACLLIFIHHCYIASSAYLGVSIFMVLSGFLMYISYRDRYSAPLSPASSLRFAAGKVKKLYPLYIITMLPILALNLYMLYAHGAGSVRELLTDLGLSLILIQAWFPGHAQAFNGVAWYLSLSLFFYFAFPYILYIMKKYRSPAAPYIALAALICVGIALGLMARPISAALYGGDNADFLFWYSYISPIFRLIDFAAGCNLACIYLARRDKDAATRTVAALELICMALLILGIYLFSRFANIPSLMAYRTGLVFLPFCLVFIYLFALGAGTLPRLLTNRVTVFLGNISAAFFLIHQDVVRYLYMALDRLGLGVAQCRPLLFLIGGSAALALSIAYDRAEKAIAKRKLTA